MDISGEYQLDADRQRVWDALNDPDMLQKCIPGCESIEREGDDAMQARILAKIGPVRAKFNTRITLENLNPPESYTLAGEAKAGASGFGRGKADVRLAEKDGGTLLGYTADFKVGGKLAQVGSRLVTGATRKTADEFFANLAREMNGSDEPAASGAAGEAPAAGDGKRWAIVAALLAAGLALYVVFA